MRLELDSKHGKITVDDKDIVMESEHYDIYEGLKAMRGGEPDKTVRCYAVHNEYGCVAVVFARNEQDAMDDAADAGKLDGCKVDESDSDYDAEKDTYLDEEVSRLGNASEPYDLSNIGLVEIPVPAFSLAGLFFASMVNDAHEHATVTYYRNFGGMNIDNSLAPQHYEVIVGNIGTVYTGYYLAEATKDFKHYVNLSESEAGRAAGEEVTLFCDGEILENYRPVKYALVDDTGTACSETALLSSEYTVEARARIEAQYCDGKEGSPVRNTWVDVSDNDAFYD